MPAENTPMKAQYNAIKAQHPDCLLFFRLGDFYEMFDEDAVVGAKELDLALTTRDRNKPEDERTPMCGIPYHSAEQYIARLIQKGYKVAVCEQMEDPATVKGIVKRDVIRIVTPGTVMESSMLRENESNYLCGIYMEGKRGAAAFCDVSTGEVCVAAFMRDAATHLLNELCRFRPREAVLSRGAAACREVRDYAEKRLGCRCEEQEGLFNPADSLRRIESQYGVSVAELGFGEDGSAQLALGALFAYLRNAQRGDMSQLRRPDFFSRGDYMELDAAALRSLELTENLRSGEKRGSLLWVLDKTCSPMGARLMRSWVARPLLSPVAIEKRLAAVAELAADNVGRGELRALLKRVGDIQRLTSRAVYGSANGRDMLALGNYLDPLPEIMERLRTSKSALLREIAATDPLKELRFLLYRCICDNPPFSVREGDILRTGYSEEVDRLRVLKENGAAMVREMETREKERTGIKKLRIGYNRVFGYYIDIPRSAGDVELPQEYIRKQTLVNAERYFTPELKALEDDILGAGEKLEKLEYEFFMDLLRHVAERVDALQALSAAVAKLDCLCSFAEVAVRNRYVCPQIELGRSLEIREGRHPVVEQMQPEILFVPNDTLLNEGADRCAIVTGPNMAGKSTYMRQTALIVLMAQMGSFVPAKSARIGVVDRVFTRIGASDDLSSGQSTFMVEMSEVASILRHATANSLLILDEIGRGTSTYDGMAIARAVLEYCADKKRLGAKTMFATHYHELSRLEGELDGVRNYNISAKKQGGRLIFLRKILPGSADESYGIEVAKLAGVPDMVIASADRFLAELESGATTAAPATERCVQPQLSLMDMGESAVAARLRSLDLNSMTPFEALSLLYELKKEVDA
ncbi:MAG: DNA mismatch repair protein MutS [Ruminococcaceae bacterium]|nr:DNA mismatch repair protein MutS [Oscillospiraceae bacterium]